MAKARPFGFYNLRKKRSYKDRKIAGIIGYVERNARLMPVTVAQIYSRRWIFKNGEGWKI